VGEPEPAPARRGLWLNRNVLGIELTSLLSGLGCETATAILPGYVKVRGARCSRWVSWRGWPTRWRASCGSGRGAPPAQCSPRTLLLALRRYPIRGGALG
jgi:hypothetical protein